MLAAVVWERAFSSQRAVKILSRVSPSSFVFHSVYSVYENVVLACILSHGPRRRARLYCVVGDQFGEANSVSAQVEVKLSGGVDGRLQGEGDVQTVPCDQTADACQSRVPVSGAAPVYFSDAQTLPTTVLTKKKNTISIDPAVLRLVTAQGMSGTDR
ncbi:hypothetical protein C8Q80DRAFT_1274457 [Daedaleopsis nitida]|nr:hypothetical protein C8Q80DRAFT_1274457 [Daedaleopsis nitida]